MYYSSSRGETSGWNVKIDFLDKMINFFGIKLSVLPRWFHDELCWSFFELCWSFFHSIKCKTSVHMLANSQDETIPILRQMSPYTAFSQLAWTKNCQFATPRISWRSPSGWPRSDSSTWSAEPSRTFLGAASSPLTGSALRWGWCTWDRQKFLLKWFKV